MIQNIMLNCAGVISVYWGRILAGAPWNICISVRNSWFRSWSQDLRDFLTSHRSEHARVSVCVESSLCSISLVYAGLCRVAGPSNNSGFTFILRKQQWVWVTSSCLDGWWVDSPLLIGVFSIFKKKIYIWVFLGNIVPKYPGNVKETSC